LKDFRITYPKIDFNPTKQTRKNLNAQFARSHARECGDFHGMVIYANVSNRTWLRRKRIFWA